MSPVKYKDGAVTGNLEYQYHDGGINLHSTGFDWLVIDGNNAQYQGTGTIKHLPGDYTFRIFCTDRKDEGLPDQITIRIWQGTDTEAEPIYKALNMDLSGGNISVKENCGH